MIDTKTINENYVDQVTAAKMLHITQGRISQLCNEGRFQGATKIGWSWLIPKTSVENFEPLKRGRKPQGHDDQIFLNQAVSNADNLKGGVIHE